MIVYYSGYGCRFSDPERFLAEQANVMLTAHDSMKRRKLDGSFNLEKRFKGVYKARKRRQREVNSNGETA